MAKRAPGRSLLKALLFGALVLPLCLTACSWTMQRIWLFRVHKLRTELLAARTWSDVTAAAATRRALIYRADASGTEGGVTFHEPFGSYLVVQAAYRWSFTIDSDERVHFVEEKVQLTGL